MVDDENQRTRENGRLPQTDLELVRRARHGEIEAFHALVDRHATYLYRLAVSLIGNAADAEDVVQETLTGAFRGLGAFRQESSVKTWLTRIIVRQAANHFRRGESRRGRTVALDAAGQVAQGPAVQAADIRLDVHEAVLALRPDHREVIVLREMQGLSYDEIAQVLGIPRGTVESRLFRARRELHTLLKDYLT